MESAFHGHEAQHRHTPEGIGLSRLNLRGLIPATVVPMTARGDIDWPALRHYLRWIATQGPVALAVTADTGEVAQLSVAEQVEVVAVAKEATEAGPALPGCRPPTRPPRR